MTQPNHQSARTSTDHTNNPLNNFTREQLVGQLAAELLPELQSCEPESGITRYLSHRKHELTDQTHSEYQNKLDRFNTFCQQREITDLNNLDARGINDYATWLREESSTEVEQLSTKTMRDEMYLFRDFISYLETIEAVQPGLSDSVPIPKLKPGDGIRNVDLAPERLTAILDYLNDYHYASLDHAIWLLLSKTGRRTGGCVSLDCPDAHLNTAEPYLEFVHRPPETRLKNGEKSEGLVAIPQSVAEVLSDYLEHTHPDVTDDVGRKPLLATTHGRVSKSTVRRVIYKWSRPCQIDSSCPEDRDISECQAAQSMDHASKCPASRSPHALKHGFITAGRRAGIPLEVLSERCDVNESVILEHYDESTEQERCKIRREILDTHSSANGGGYL